MRHSIRVAAAVLVVVGTSITLGGCARHKHRVAMSRPSPHVPTTPVIQPTPGDGAAAVWNLRAGLNVAALSCRGRGRQSVAGDYARLLTRHKALLAAAYRREQTRQGANAFDRQQTRLYNGFANQASPAHFCRTAGAVVQRAIGLDSAALSVAAPGLLGELRASLRYRPLASR
jgi:hypothetical protein